MNQLSSFYRLGRLLVLVSICWLGNLAWSFAQGTSSAWQEIGPLINPITEMSYNGSQYLYASSTAGVYRSADMGNSWEFIFRNAGWERSGGDFASYTGSNRGFVHVNGITYALWFSRDPFYPDVPYLEAVDGSGYYQGVCTGHYDYCVDPWEIKDLVQWNNRAVLSTGNRGEIWYLDLPNGTWQVVNHSAKTLWNDGNQLWSGYDGYVAISNDGGQSWQPYAGGNLPGDVSGFAKKGKRVFASVWGHGVFVSFDDGAWTNVSSNLPSLNVRSITSHGNVIHIAVSGNWVWKTFNNGQSWIKAAKTGTHIQSVACLNSLNGRLFVGGPDGISKRAEGSDAWTTTIKGLSNSSVHWLAAQNNSIIASKTIGEYSDGSPEYEGALYANVSHPPYNRWYGGPVWSNYGFRGMQQQGNLVLAWTGGDSYREFYPELYTSYLNGGGPNYVFDLCYYDDYTDEEECQYEFSFRSVAAIGEYVFAVSSTGRIGIADDYGYNNNSEHSFVFQQGPAPFTFLRVHGGLLYACSTNGLYTSSDLGQTWTPIGLQGLIVRDLVRGNGYWLALTNGGLYRVMDSNPASWQSLNVFIYGPKIVFMDQVLYTIVSGDVSYSLDKGNSWQILPRDPGVPRANPNALAVEGNDYLFIGTDGRGIWRHPAIPNPNSAARLAQPEATTLRVHPNPTQGYLSLESEFSGQLSLWSLDGRLIQQRSLDAGEHSLDLASQPAGLYLLRWETSEGVEIRKIQKH